jgi:dimeric dUTPase (all-alpha-NTP-PPase superfamily)
MNLTDYMQQQFELQDELDHPMGIGDGAVKENILAAIVELTELLQEINWKPWRKTEIKKSPREVVLGEILDVFHFYLNILNELSVTEEEFDNAWAETNRKIRRRNANGY